MGGSNECGAAEKEVVAVVGVLGGNKLGFKAELGKALGGEAADGIDAWGVGGEAIAIHHAAEPSQGCGEMAFGGSLEFVGESGGHGQLHRIRREIWEGDTLHGCAFPPLEKTDVFCYEGAGDVAEVVRLLWGRCGLRANPVARGTILGHVG
jgi:hypothetical protein